MSFIQGYPADLFKIFAGFLEVKDRATLSRVCKRWREILPFIDIAEKISRSRCSTQLKIPARLFGTYGPYIRDLSIRETFNLDKLEQSLIARFCTRLQRLSLTLYESPRDSINLPALTYLISNNQTTLKMLKLNVDIEIVSDLDLIRHLTFPNLTRLDIAINGGLTERFKKWCENDVKVLFPNLQEITIPDVHGDLLDVDDERLFDSDDHRCTVVSWFPADVSVAWGKWSYY